MKTITVWSEYEVLALCSTVLSGYMLNIRKNKDFAAEVAGLIEELDKEHPNDEKAWQKDFADANSPDVEYVFGIIAKAKSTGLIE